MADKIIFPGTAMEVFEKYPASRRLDHPTFGDVCKTTYAVGVITDFEKIQDDPIQVKSRVKVKIGDGEESDFIPLFFNPKALYWDGDGVLAQDFDEEMGAFKQAWQSFRGGDEVAVMLKEGVPVAVMGFADGVPRIGEDIGKLVAPAPNDPLEQYFQMSKQNTYPSGAGPDSLGLGLLTVAQCLKSPIRTQGTGNFDNSAPYGYNTISDGGYDAEGVQWLETTANIRIDQVAVYMINVGAICYLNYVEFYHQYTCYLDHYWGEAGSGLPGAIKTRTVHVYGINRRMMKAATYQNDLAQKVLDSLNGMTITASLAISAYHSGTWNDWWPVTIDGVTLQQDLTAIMNGVGFLRCFSVDEVQWMIRPHTKAELQAAGMWPAGAS